MISPDSSTQILKRGTYKFETSTDGKLIYNQDNLEKMRSLFLDKKIVGNALGPGEPGDFDNGAWHIVCHLVAGCAIMKRPTGELLWIEISHIPVLDLYVATVTVEYQDEAVRTFPISSIEGKMFLKDAFLLGFVEGSSRGHISACSVNDSQGMFNDNLRQNYHWDEQSTNEGGRVWEHWCTLRNIRQENIIGTSVLNAYLQIVSLCGGSFVSVVGRGRIEHDHPVQLIALVKSGFISEDDALIDINPSNITLEVEAILYSSLPDKSLNAVKRLIWSDSTLKYYMYTRRITQWASKIFIQDLLNSSKLNI